MLTMYNTDLYSYTQHFDPRTPTSWDAGSSTYSLSPSYHDGLSVIAAPPTPRSSRVDLPGQVVHPRGQPSHPGGSSRRETRTEVLSSLKEKSGWDSEDDIQDRGGLKRVIGYLANTACADWSLALKTCRRATANETTAREAGDALRFEFKYGTPQSQIGAAKLWAVMLRLSPDLVICETTSPKFLTALKRLLLHGCTTPVVRERVLSVLSAATYAAGPGEGQCTGVKALWMKFKSPNMPEEGAPLAEDDPILNKPFSYPSRAARFTRSV